MIVLLIVSITIYSWVILRRRDAWIKMQSPTIPMGWCPTKKLSVIIPVRNEAVTIAHLLRDLEKQHYPKELFEVIVVDDHSEDETTTIVEHFLATTELKVKLLILSEFEGLSHKKAAVQKGIEVAQGELLLFTDGDCRVQPNWLKLFAYTFESKQMLFISGAVSFRDTKSLLERMQEVEFASLIGIGGASIALGKPNMCNGANLAYTKSVFEAVNGFAGNENIASGDDEFLLHKINRQFPGQVAFLKNSGAIVHTSAQPTIARFMAQRIRWASKWRAYQEMHVKLLAVLVFMVNLLLFIAMLLILTGKLALWVFLASITTKFAIDFLFLKHILDFTGRRSYIFYMLPLQLVYIPYVVIAAVAGLFGRYRWKGRQIQNP